MITDGSAAPGRQQWTRLWRFWDIATTLMISPGHHRDRPLETRQPFIFYLGHLPAFADSRLSVVLQQPLTEPTSYADMFARGIDPDLDDPTQCHAHSPTPRQWPDVKDILAYRDRVRARILQLYQGSNSNASTTPLATSSSCAATLTNSTSTPSSSAHYLDISSCKPATTAEDLATVAAMPTALQHVLWMAYEHEAMHLETMLYLLVQYTAVLPPPADILPALPEAMWCSCLAYPQLAPTLLTTPDQRNNANCPTRSNRPGDGLHHMHASGAAQQDQQVQCDVTPLAQTENACAGCIRDHHGAFASTDAHGSLPAADGSCSGLSMRSPPHFCQQEHVSKQQQQLEELNQQQQRHVPKQQQQYEMLPLPPEASWIRICDEGDSEVPLGFNPEHQDADQLLHKLGGTAAARAVTSAAEETSKFCSDSTVTSTGGGTTSISSCCSANPYVLSDAVRFGWDNECPARTVSLQQVSLQHRAVTVVEYLSFLAAQLVDSSLREMQPTQQPAVQDQASPAAAQNLKDGVKPASAAVPAPQQAAAVPTTWASLHGRRHDEQISSDASNRDAVCSVMYSGDAVPPGHSNLLPSNNDASNGTKTSTLPQMLHRMSSSTASVCMDCRECLEQLLHGPSMALLVPASLDMREASADRQAEGRKDVLVMDGCTDAHAKCTADNRHQHQHTPLADRCILPPCRGTCCDSNVSRCSGCSGCPACDMGSSCHPSCILRTRYLDHQQDLSPTGPVSGCHSPAVRRLQQEQQGPLCQGPASNLLLSGSRCGVLCTGLCKLVVPSHPGRHVLKGAKDYESQVPTCTSKPGECFCRHACGHTAPAMLANINTPVGTTCSIYTKQADATSSCSGSDGMVQAAASDRRPDPLGNANCTAACAVLQTALMQSLQLCLGVKSLFGAVPCCIAGYWPVYCSALQAEQYIAWVNAAHGLQCRLPSEAEIAAARRHNALLSNRTLSTPAAAAAAEAAAAASKRVLGIDVVVVDGSDGRAACLAQHTTSDKLYGSARPQSSSAATLSTQLDGCSVNFAVWHPVCVPLRPSTADSGVSAGALQDGCTENKLLSETSQHAVSQLSDNGWEWTSTTFTRHEGFTPHPLYPEYSQDFFQGKHAVLLGGSWATVDSIARRSTFRNWYQRGQQHVFAKFRLCHSHGS